MSYSSMSYSLGSACSLYDGHCRSYRPGHNIHAIQAGYLGRSPGAWRDATVTAVDGQHARIRFSANGVEFTAWHHRAWDTLVTVGADVQVHFHAGSVVRAGQHVICIDHDCPPDGEPARQESASPAPFPVIAEVATGLGIDGSQP